MTTPTRIIGTLLALLISTLLLTTTANAATKCGTELQRSNGAVFRVTAHRTNCKIARSVAGNWYAHQAAGIPTSTPVDNLNRRWHCHIVRKATGDDPDATIRYTDIRCWRGTAPAVITFSLRA